MATTARADGIAQAINVVRQLWNTSVSNGTVAPEAMPALALTNAVNRPVVDPIRCGKSRRIKMGPRTFATAIPIPASRVPNTSAGHHGAPRSTVPTKISMRHPVSTTGTVHRRAARVAATANTPRHTTGPVVSSAAEPEPSP